MSAAERNAQPFSTQSGGQQRKTIGKFMEAFEEAGHDVAGLFAHFLETSPVGSKSQADLRQNIRDVLRDASTESEKTLDQLLEAIRELHGAKETKDRERLRIMSLLAPIFTRADLIRRGFRVSNDAFANARRHASSVGPGAPVQVGGRPRLYTPELALLIDNFCCRPEIAYANPTFISAHQSLDPTQLILLEGEPMLDIQDETGVSIPLPIRATFLSENGKEIPSRILRVSVQTLFARFTEVHPEYTKLSFPGFRSLLPKNIVRRSRENDGDELEELEQDPVVKRKRGRPKQTAMETATPDNHALLIHHDEIPHEGNIPISHLPHTDMETEYHLHPEDEDLVQEEEIAHPPIRKRAKLEGKK